MRYCGTGTTVTNKRWTVLGRSARFVAFSSYCGKRDNLDFSSCTRHMTRNGLALARPLLRFERRLYWMQSIVTAARHSPPPLFGRRRRWFVQNGGRGRTGAAQAFSGHSSGRPVTARSYLSSQHRHLTVPVPEP